jgi:vacuolar protein sorting-associated protein 54
VFPWTQVETSKPAQQGKKRQSSKLLQEKLSHYLDIVEVQIARQVSCKSEAFFHAMTSHDDLDNHMLETCAAIKHLRYVLVWEHRGCTVFSGVQNAPG